MTTDENSEPDRKRTEQPLVIHAPERSPSDEPISISITGIPPGGTVEFTATLEDSNGIEWASHLEFTADENGVVDFTNHAPESGAYEGVHSMGWMWAMRTDADVPFARLFGDSRSELSIDLSASTRRSDNNTMADRASRNPPAQAVRTIKRVLAGDITDREVDHEPLVGTLYVPTTDEHTPGIIHLHGSGGRQSDTTARLLASKGYAVLALEYFGDAEVLPDELERIQLSYVDTAATWLREQPVVSGDKVGLVGASRGAELALVLGARYDWVGAIVSYAGSIPWDTPSGAPAWEHDGEPVPHIVGDPHPAATDLTAADLEGAVPAVEETEGPILLLSGGDDNVWPARELSGLITDRLNVHDFPYAYEHRTYDDVGHLIGIPYAPLSGLEESDRVGGTAKATVKASEDSWSKIQEYLATGLKPNGRSPDTT